MAGKATITTAGGLSGSAARTLFHNSMDVGAVRPFVGRDGRSYITVNGAVREFHGNALLRKDEWVHLDTTVVETARRELTIINDLRAAGLSRDVGNLGTTIIEYERSGDLGPARVDMSGTTRGDEDTMAFDLAGVPLPITHKQFRLNLRRLQASRNLGQGLDVSQAALAARIVAETLDDMVFNGVPDLSIDGRSVPGLLTHADRNIGTLSADWTDPAATPLADVQAMINASRASHYRGPYMLYVPDSYYTLLSDDYKAESDKTWLERISALPAIQGVKATGSLPDGNVVLVQLTSDVIELGEAQDITTVDWDEQGGFEAHFKVFAGIVPIIKSTYARQSGVTHFSVAG